MASLRIDAAVERPRKPTSRWRAGTNSTVLIGRSGAAIVATAMVGHDGHRGWVYYVTVDPDHRAQGYGRAIMNAAEDWLLPGRHRQIAIAGAADERRSARSTSRSATPRQETIDLRQMARWPRAYAITEAHRQDRMTISDRVRVKNVELLSDDYYLLNKTTFEYRRANGEWQSQARETYDRGNCATVLPYNLAQRTVILVRQFRYPAYVNGYDDLLIEAAAGVLDGETPEVRIRAEAEEETGYRLGEIKKIFEAFSSPGSVTEKLHFFVAEYDPVDAGSAAAADSPKKARTSRCWNCRSTRRSR